MMISLYLFRRVLIRIFVVYYKNQVILMNSKAQSEPDSILRVHLDTLNSQHQLNNKVTYALACIHNAIALTNNSRRPNIFYLKKYKDTFLKLIS